MVEACSTAVTEIETGIETEDEFYVELAAACKQAIRQSGMSREQVLDEINRRFGRTGEDGRKPLSIHMFNNHLSKPQESRVPAWLVWAVCRATGSLAPFRVQVEALGGVVAAAEEETELLFGKLERHIRQLQAAKRSLARRLGGNTKGEKR
jgi:hypothetical protein